MKFFSSLRLCAFFLLRVKFFFLFFYKPNRYCTAENSFRTFVRKTMLLQKNSLEFASYSDDSEHKNLAQESAAVSEYIPPGKNLQDNF